MDFRSYEICDRLRNLENFSNTYEQVFLDHICFIKSLAYYIFHNVGKIEAWEEKLKKYGKKLKRFCKKYLKVIAVKKLTLILSPKGDGYLHENIEFVINYRKNEKLIDRYKKNKFVETTNKYGGSVKTII